MAKTPAAQRTDTSVWPDGQDWPDLADGAALTIVKLAPDGSEVTRYPGAVMADTGISPWLRVAARWTNRRVDLDGLSFVPGDVLIEFFSPIEPFNAFAVYAPNGDLRGWYANVTYPATLDLATVPPTLFWRDLYLDVVALPGGIVSIRDEDELAEAGLEGSDPALHRAIVAAKDEILRRFQSRAVPFHPDSPPGSFASG